MENEKDLTKYMPPVEPEKEAVHPTQSTQVNELVTALAKAQGEMQLASKNQKNTFFKSGYADYDEIVSSSRPALTKNGLAVTHQLISNGSSLLITTLWHSSGQFLSSIVKIKPDKQDIQTIGKYITYMKRYSYAALVGVTVGEVDDDGESLMNRSPEQSSGNYSTRRPHLVTK